MNHQIAAVDDYPSPLEWSDLKWVLDFKEDLFTNERSFGEHGISEVAGFSGAALFTPLVRGVVTPLVDQPAKSEKLLAVYLNQPVALYAWKRWVFLKPPGSDIWPERVLVDGSPPSANFVM
jgi:hypothetical protein